MTGEQLDEVDDGVEGGEDGEAEGGPVDDGALLLSKDGEKTVGDDEGTEDITLLVLVLDVADGGGGQEEETKLD